MVVDFSALDYRDGPILVLKNLDGTPIQPLGYAYNITAKLMYNEVSELSFEIPAYVDGVAVPHYEDVVGMKIIDMIGVGQFVLSNPKEKNDGIKAYRQCTAYSLEYELTYKKIFISEGTYNFWNPVAQKDTVVGMILELFPSWSVGAIDEALWGKYRTFSVENDSAYDFIKGTLQDTYQCIFDFDTYQRKINVRAISSSVATAPVFLSLDNLIKEISIEEDTENIFTCLDVNGADGVDIRSVNPLGTNKVYNLDYFMVEGNVPRRMVDQWNSWKQTFQNHQQVYFNLTIEKALEESRLETARAELISLEGELKKHETLQSAYVESAAQGIDRSKELADIKKTIASQNSAISKKKDSIAEIQKAIDELYESQKKINQTCSLSAFFSAEELTLLDRYIKEDAISEDSFVYRSVASYTDEDVSKNAKAISVRIENSSVTRVVGIEGKDIYSLTGGTLNATDDAEKIKAEVIRAAIEKKASEEYVLTAYLGSGSYGETKFPGGCISLVGSGATVNTDVKPDPEISGNYFEGTFIEVNSGDSALYFTMNATEYAKRSVEWDLFEYGMDALEELSAPSYTFSIDSSNFLALDEFTAFKNKFRLGDKVYLELSANKHLSPIVIGAEIDCEDPSKLNLLFGDKYSASDSAFELVDLLEQSVSMGKTVASNKSNYNSFISSGASTSVRDFITSALDVSKNAVLSSTGQAIQWDGSGLRLRKRNSANTDYEPEQVWMINNSIAFTDDGWNTAKMAIGKFNDPNTGVSWGVVAPAIVGTLLAGSNLVIESAKKDGSIAAFRVDADGARLYNSRFDLVNEYSPGKVGQITMVPPVGLVGGSTTSAAPLFSYDAHGNVTGVLTQRGSTLQNLSAMSKNDLPRANFWVDMLGNAYFNGTVIATDGKFSGTVNAQNLQLGGVDISKLFTAAGDGAQNPDGSEGCDYLQIGSIIIDGKSGSISFTGGNEPVKVRYSRYKNGPWQSNWNSSWVDVVVYAQYSYDNGKTWGAAIQVQSVNGEDGKPGSDANVPSYITETKITSTKIESPTIIGNNIATTGHFTVLGDIGGDEGNKGYFGGANGLDASGNITYGVALSNADITNLQPGFEQSGGRAPRNYLIVTNGGVRMQAGDHSLTLTANTGCWVDGVLVGTTTATWG